MAWADGTPVRTSGEQTASGVTSDSYTWSPSNPSVGNHCIGYCGIYYSLVQVDRLGWSDNQSNTYTTAAYSQQPAYPNNHITAQIVSSKIATSTGTHTVTVVTEDIDSTEGDNQTFYAHWGLQEWDGLASASWLDKTGTNLGAVTTDASASASGANSQASVLAVAVFGDDADDRALSISNSSGYTAFYTENDGWVPGGQAAYKKITSSETSSITWSHDNPSNWYGWAAVIATFKAATTTAYTIDTSQAITVTDVPTATLATARYKPNVSDTVTVTDVQTATLATARLKPDVADTVTVTDVPTAAVATARYKPDVADTITVTDVLRLGLNPELLVADSITVTDDPSATLNQARLKPDVADSITITEALRLGLNPELLVADAITVTDNATMTLSSGEVINWTITAREYTTRVTTTF